MSFRTIMILLSIATKLHTGDPEIHDYIDVPIDTNNLQSIPLHDDLNKQQHTDYATIPSSTSHQKPPCISVITGHRGCIGTALGSAVGALSGGLLGNAIATTSYAVALGGLSGFFLGGVAGGFLSVYLFKVYYDGTCWCKPN